MPRQRSSFLEYLEDRQERIRRFLARHEDLNVVIDAGIELAHGLASVSTVSAPPSETKLWCGILWQRISNYQLQSIELILGGDLDAGMALLRMAAELARDVAVLGRDEAQFATWKNREVNSEAYRKRFKFDHSPPGRAAYDLYKFASRFGVHGHQTTIAQARPNSRDIGNDRVVHFEVDEDAPLQVIDIWLRSFFPLHALCAEAVGVDNPEKHEPFASFVSFVHALTPVLEAIKVHRGPESRECARCGPIHLPPDAAR